MNWHVVFNSRTKFSDYRNIAPLPKMSDEAAKCFREQRRLAQNGEIDGAVHVAVTPEDVLLFRIRLTGMQDSYGREIRCAEGLYGTSADIRRDWETIVALAFGLWSQEESWYAQIVQEEDISLLTPEQAVDELLETAPAEIPGAIQPESLLYETDEIVSFTIREDGIFPSGELTHQKRAVWKPGAERRTYRLICHISKGEKKAWLEAVDCVHEKRTLAESERVLQNQYGFSVKRLRQAAEALRSYMEEYGWREEA